jgi:hypothetical protein
MAHALQRHGKPLALVIAAAVLLALGASIRVAVAEDASPAAAAASHDATGGRGKAGEAPVAPRAVAAQDGLPPELEQRGGHLLAQALGGLGGALVLLAATYLLARRRARR